MKGLHVSAAVAALAAMSMVSGEVVARSASSMSYLVGELGRNGEQELQKQGFAYAAGRPGGNSVTTFWWHEGDKNCIAVRTRDGRYASITDATRQDCNKKSGGNGAGVAVAAVAGAALIAALASGHKDHDRDDGYYNGQYDYLRGMRPRRARDELYSRGFQSMDQYSEGYRNIEIFYRRRSDECIEMSSANREVQSVRNTSHRRCR